MTEKENQDNRMAKLRGSMTQVASALADIAQAVEDGELRAFAEDSFS